jgi:hypothetical protein
MHPWIFLFPHLFPPSSISLFISQFMTLAFHVSNDLVYPYWIVYLSLCPFPSIDLSFDQPHLRNIGSGVWTYI